MLPSEPLFVTKHGLVKDFKLSHLIKIKLLVALHGLCIKAVYEEVNAHKSPLLKDFHRFVNHLSCDALILIFRQNCKSRNFSGGL